MTGLFDFGLGLGLASLSGIRGFFPLVTLGLVTRFGKGLTLQPPFQFLNYSVVLLVLIFLMALEFIADKLPAAESYNQLIQIPVRVVTGALVFASVMRGGITFYLILGALISLGIIILRPIIREALINSTDEDNDYFISSLEDILTITGTFTVILAPFLALIGLVIAGYMGYRNFRDRSGARYSWRG